MSSDSRLWAKVDLGYLTNPKMSDVLDASSNAVCMHLASILHCAQHLTDGHVSPKAMTRAVGGDSKDIGILIKAGLWHEPGHECDECPQPEEGRVYVHNYLNHNVSSEKINRKSEQASRAAKARWDKKKGKDSNAGRNADRMQSALPNAMLDRSDRSDQIDTLSSHVASDDAGRSEPEPEEEFSEDVTALCNHLADWITRNGNRKPTVGKTWMQAIDRLIRIDEYTPDNIRQVIDWCQQDEFWQANILSAGKLRKQFDQLKNRMFQENSRKPQTQHMTADQRRLQAGLERRQRIMEGQLNPLQLEAPHD